MSLSVWLSLMKSFYLPLFWESSTTERENQRNVDANLARIDDLAASSALLGCNLDTSRHYGRIKNDLRAKGRPIPENDIWIAAVAQQHGLTLVSRDIHFSEVDTLTLEVW